MYALGIAGPKPFPAAREPSPLVLAPLSTSQRYKKLDAVSVSPSNPPIVLVEFPRLVLMFCEIADRVIFKPAGDTILAESAVIVMTLFGVPDEFVILRLVAPHRGA